MDIEELTAREAIRDVIARYNHAGDRGQLDDLVACFTEDGVMELPDTPPLRGHDAIRQHLEGVVATLRASTERATLAHHVASLRIQRTAPDAARADAYFSVYTEIGLDHWGRYSDRLLRSEDRWRIALRRVRVDGAVARSRMVSQR